MLILTVNKMRNQVAAAQKLTQLRNDWTDLKRLSVEKCQLETRSLYIQPALLTNCVFCDNVTANAAE